MTDSPINLDEALSIIAKGKSRHTDGYGTTNDIDYRYLESIVKELVAARERIAELETECDEKTAILIETQAQLGAGSQVYKERIEELKGKLANAIIPQAEDADSLSFMLEYLCDDPNDNRDPAIDIAKKVVRRYLAAIEGGKP